MRLTLRTLLAYMDDILDPGDQEELGRKIESSPFATELIHRSRDAVRRLRLSAPDVLAGDSDDVHGGDHNLDANTAAEYLDNTLSPEAVADFERSCLEAGPNADMLLAEAASCHHVLTMVLGEPAEVDADLRQRMYALAQSPAAAKQVRIEPAHQAPGQEPAAAAAAPPATAVRRPQVDADEASVPDYILAAARQQRRARRRAMALAAAVLVGGFATWLFWPQEVKEPDELAAMGGADKIAQEVQIGDEAPAGDTATTGDDADPDTADDEAPPFVPQVKPTEPPEETTTTEPQPSAETSPPATTPPAVEPTAESPAPPAEADAAVAAPPGGPDGEGGPPMVDSPPADATVETPTQDPGVTAATANLSQTPTTPGPAGAETTAATASEATAVAPPAATSPIDGSPASVPDTVEGAAATAAAPAPPKPIGAYLGNNDVLLQFDSVSEAWVRLPPRSAFMGGEQLLSLPTFRTHVVLADINAYLAGGAQIDLVKPGESSPGALALHIPYGRVVFNSGLDGNQLELSLVDQVRTIQLGPSSSLAVEVRRVFEPGGAASREPAPATVTWYLTSGSAEWGEGQSAEAPAMWTTVGGEDSDPAALEELPDWVDREPVTDIERRARERIAEALVPGEPVNTTLLELSDPSERGRRTEDRALAAFSGAYVGQYDALVRALSDVNQRASWKNQIEALRQAIARDSAAAEGIREAFAMERGQEAADDLMEMLLGFDRAAVGTTKAEVQQGALVRLLRWMNDDDLTYRILASHNVNEITGTRELGGYQPQHTAEQRKRSLRHYWERLEGGELLPREAR